MEFLDSILVVNQGLPVIEKASSFPNSEDTEYQLVRIPQLRGESQLAVWKEQNR